MKFKAAVMESERGWGCRVDEIKEFDTEQERDEFIARFNAQNDSTVVPDWYMYAEKV